MASGLFLNIPQMLGKKCKDALNHPHMQWPEIIQGDQDIDQTSVNKVSAMLDCLPTLTPYALQSFLMEICLLDTANNKILGLSGVQFTVPYTSDSLKQSC